MPGRNHAIYIHLCNTRCHAMPFYALPRLFMSSQARPDSKSILMHPYHASLGLALQDALPRKFRPCAATQVPLKLDFSCVPAVLRNVNPWLPLPCLAIACQITITTQSCLSLDGHGHAMPQCPSSDTVPCRERTDQKYQWNIPIHASAPYHVSSCHIRWHALPCYAMRARTKIRFGLPFTAWARYTTSHQTIAHFWRGLQSFASITPHRTKPSHQTISTHITSHHSRRHHHGKPQQTTPHQTTLQHTTPRHHTIPDPTTPH